MRWKLLFGGLGLGALVVVLVAVIVVVGAIAGVVWVLNDGQPLLYYDSRPATVTDEGQRASGYQFVNGTDFDVAPLPWPVVSGELEVRVWLSVYVGGVDANLTAVQSAPGPNATGGPPAEPGAATGGTTASEAAAGSASTDGANGSAATGGASGSAAAGGANGSAPVPDASTIDGGNVSVAAVVTTSAMELGPIACNPLVYASDPGLLEHSGFVIDELEERADWTLTDLSIRRTERVTMLGRSTEMTELRGTITPEGSAEEVRVTIHLARVVHEGDLVAVVALSPDSADAEARFVTLIEHLEHGDGAPGGDRARSRSTPTA